MSGVPEDAVQLVSGLLGHIKQIVGDGASYAMLHYGAVEEGKRIGSAYNSQDLVQILGRIDSALAQQSEVIKDDGTTVTVRVHSSALLRTGHRSVQGIVVGLLEGALSASRHGRYKGTVVQPLGQDELVAELKREG
ncbi:MAG: hypothetical protein WDA16_09745 [Candidatus Thermoplasmatota archaeon]